MHKSRHSSSIRGFTLVEMSIVLIIIGIILGAVIKGKDLIRSGEQKRLYNSYIQQWQIAYQNYYDRTGWVLGDANDATNQGTRDGLISTTTLANLTGQLTAVGLEAPPNPTTSANPERTYQGPTGQARIRLRFIYNATFGNHIRLDNAANGRSIPYDLGLALDRIVDGDADGTTGDLLYVVGTTPTAWPVPIPATTAAGSYVVFRLSI